MSTDPYNTTVRDYFASPVHAGVLDDAATGYFEDQGLRVELKARVRGECVEAMRFRAHGCPHTIAAAEWICRQYEGAAVAALGNFELARVMRDLAVPVEKTGRILVLEDAVRSLGQAIKDRKSGKGS